jgi:hypothetical protein
MGSEFNETTEFELWLGKIHSKISYLKENHMEVCGDAASQYGES